MDKYTQKMRIIAYIKKYGGITKKQAINELDIGSITGRITELRQDGFPIITVYVEGKNRFGERTHHAVWKLKEEEQSTPFTLDCPSR